MSKNQILLFYKYIKINSKDLEDIKKWQMSMCKELGLKGRVLLAEEGINGTLEGEIGNTEEYIHRMNEHELFNGIHWKKSEGTIDGTAFPKISVKIRSEIVSLHLGKEDFNPADFTANHLDPDELQNWYDDNKEFYVVDMRNDYELEVGKFDKTVFPGLRNFRDLSKKLKTIKHLKDKTVLAVCTGGVRCEKASGYLMKKGFKDVHQLNGGIVSYMKNHPSQNFKGSLYTFDSRTTMHFDASDQHTIIGTCRSCERSSENYGNCARKKCNLHMIVCENCIYNNVYCSFMCKIKDMFASIKNQDPKTKIQSRSLLGS